MKKFLAFVMVCVLLVSLAACRNTEENPTNGTTAPIGSETQNNSNETQDTTVDTPSDNTDSSEATGENESVAPSDATTTPEETTEATEPTSNTEATNEATAPSEQPTAPPVGHTHSYTSTITAPTCEKGGQTTHKCDCGDSYVTDKTNATGHAWGEWVTTEESTVTKNGTAERKCSACGKTETKQLDKLPIFHTHSYTDKVVAPTCTSEGYTIHTCSCGDTYTDTKTAKTAHNYKSTVTKPTCTTEGYTTYTCSCGDTYIADKTAKTAHTYKDTVTPPTCTAEGYTTHKCTKCGGTVVDTKVAATGHSYSDTVVEPTCENGGYTQHTCSTCGSSYTDNQKAATGHNNTLVSDTATCTADGTKTEKCSTCGKTQTSTSKAKGHGETRTETTGASCTGTGVEKTICTVCNAVISEKTIQGSGAHNWEYKPCSEVVKDEMNRGLMSQPKYASFTDHCVAVCSECKTSNWDDIVQRYSDYETAAIMLGYVNSLRESVLGTSEYNLVLDNGLINYAKTRAKEISTNFAHTGKYSENITSAGSNIYGQFMAWKNSTGHYNNMINAEENSVGYCGHVRFGYAMYRVGTALYGVQIFAQ